VVKQAECDKECLLPVLTLPMESYNKAEGCFTLLAIKILKNGRVVLNAHLRREWRLIGLLCKLRPELFSFSIGELVFNVDERNLADMHGFEPTLLHHDRGVNILYTSALTKIFIEA
jgi:hypothetical protein